MSVSFVIWSPCIAISGSMLSEILQLRNLTSICSFAQTVTPCAYL